MRAIRSILFWMHLAAGVVAGAIVLIMSATGVALTYQRQMQHWADVRDLSVSARPGAIPLAADSLLQLVVTREGKSPSAVLWRVDPSAPVEVNFGREGRQYVDPYTGAVLGTGSASMRKFFSIMTDWHRWLARQGEQRASGRKLTGASNLAFLFIVLSGMWLWWPRNLTWKSVRQVTWFRGGLSAKARDFNWHNVIGFWSALPLAVVVASGVVISYPWASALVYRAVGEAPPAPAAPVGNAEGRTAEVRRAENSTAGNAATPEARTLEARTTGAGTSGNTVVAGDVVSIASARVPEWTSVSLAWPRNAKAPLVYTIDAGTGGEPQKRGTLTVSRTSDSTTWAPFASQTPGRRLRSWLRFLHTGEALGLTGQTIAGLVSLGALVLVYTGIALSIRRLFAFVGRRTRAS